MNKIESFKDWAQKKDPLIEEGLKDLAMAGALAAGSLLNPAAINAANTSVDPSVVAPEDSVGAIPQIRTWTDQTGSISKKGHLEKVDNNFAYIRSIENELLKVPRKWLSDEDQLYVTKHENIPGIGSNPNVNIFGGDGANQPNQDFAAQGLSQNNIEKVIFNPNFGPRPSKNATPMQVYRHQLRLTREVQHKLNQGTLKKVPLDYLILHKYYKGQMPDPPE